MPTTTIPHDWALHNTDFASQLVYDLFLSHVQPRSAFPVPHTDPNKIDVVTFLACCNLARVLAAAYLNPSEHPNSKYQSWSSPDPSLYEVRLDIDIIRYNEALDKNESGLNENREQSLLKKFPPSELFFLNSPAVILDAGGRTIVWYLPGAITDLIQVLWSIHPGDVQL
jgi:hypothetical protein